MTPIRSSALLGLMLVAGLSAHIHAQEDRDYSYEMFVYRLDASAFRTMEIDGRFVPYTGEETEFGDLLEPGERLALGNVSFSVDTEGRLVVEGASNGDTGWPVLTRTHTGGEGKFGVPAERTLNNQSVRMEFLHPVKPDGAETGRYQLVRVKVNEQADWTVSATAAPITGEQAPHFDVAFDMHYEFVVGRDNAPGTTLNVGPPRGHVGELGFDERWPFDGRLWRIQGMAGEDSGVTLVAMRFEPKGAPAPPVPAPEPRYTIQSRLFRLSGAVTLDPQKTTLLECADGYTAYRLAENPFSGGNDLFDGLEEAGVRAMAYTSEYDEPVEVEFLSASRLTLSQRPGYLFKLVVSGDRAFGGGGAIGGGGGTLGGGGTRGSGPATISTEPTPESVSVFGSVFPDLGPAGDRLVQHAMRSGSRVVGFVCDVDAGVEVPYRRKFLGFIPKRESIVTTGGFASAVAVTSAEPPRMNLDVGYAYRFAENGLDAPYASKAAAETAMVTAWFLDAVEVAEGRATPYLLSLSENEHLLVTVEVSSFGP